MAKSRKKSKNGKKKKLSEEEIGEQRANELLASEGKNKKTKKSGNDNDNSDNNNNNHAHKIVDITDEKQPRCIIVRRHKIGRFLSELVNDLRLVWSPNTAKKLKERKNASMRDYTSVASVLGLTHILTLSQAKTSSPNLKIGRFPRGPTLTFKVEEFATGAMIRKVQKKPVGTSDLYNSPPLVVLNNFASPTEDNESWPKYSGLLATTFQAMFPSIDVSTVKLKDCRRVLLVNFNEASELVDIRHYYVKAEPIDASRTVKKLIKARVPNLRECVDVAEVIESKLSFDNDGGATSDSEGEDATVSLSGNFGVGNRKGKRSAVKLVELGPRLCLKLLKVEDGLFEGETTYHRFQTRTEAEVSAQRQQVEEGKKLLEERRRIQQENVERKRKKEEERAERKKAKTEERLQRLKQLGAGAEEEEKEEKEILVEERKAPKAGVKRVKRND